MCLTTLHDRVRNLGLGLMYEKHWASGFRDLFDDRSPEWPATDVAQKVVDLQAFESAGVPVDELIGHYRETFAREGDGGRRVLDGLPTAMRAYREAGYRPRLPDDVAAAVDNTARVV